MTAPSVLIVEDHAVMGQLLARYLREKGNMTVCAVVYSAESALQQLPQLNVDLVLIDVSLPTMSGIELVTALQQQWPDLPCLIVSGHLEQSYIQRALGAGARGYVGKGDPPALLEAVQRVLAGEIYLSPELRQRPS
jgi:DNA-binding NarL/FixJ family response regulator